jgi:hypothetical protein
VVTGKGPRIRKLWPFVVVLIGLMPSSTLLMFGTADDSTNDSRFKSLGHRVICTCDKQPAVGMGGVKGCRQALIECGHVDCPTAQRMRQELKAALRNGGDTDDMILNSFVQKYGASVLQVPREISGRLVWIVALPILATVCIIMLFVLRKQRSRAAMLTTTTAQPQSINADALHHVREEDE